MWVVLTFRERSCEGFKDMHLQYPKLLAFASCEMSIF